MANLTCLQHFIRLTRIARLVKPKMCLIATFAVRLSESLTKAPIGKNNATVRSQQANDSGQCIEHIEQPLPLGARDFGDPYCLLRFCTLPPNCFIQTVGCQPHAAALGNLCDQRNHDSGETEDSEAGCFDWIAN